MIYSIIEFIGHKEVKLEQAQFIFDTLLMEYNRDNCTLYKPEEVYKLSVSLMNDEYYNSFKEAGIKIVKEELESAVVKYNDYLKSIGGSGNGWDWTETHLKNNIESLSRPDAYKSYVHSHQRADNSRYFSGQSSTELTILKSNDNSINDVVDEIAPKYERITNTRKYYGRK